MCIVLNKVCTGLNQVDTLRSGDGMLGTYARFA